MNPSEVQRQASDPDYSVYVSASAGTGKTKILCDRFLRLMLAGSPPENILCVTFTNAAAAEMEDRIRATLKIWHEASTDKLNHILIELTGIQATEAEFAKAKGLYQQFLSSLSHIRIQTLHSLCTDILQYYVIPDSPGGTKIIDSLLRTRYLRDCFTKTINNSNNSEYVKTLSQYYDFERLLGVIASVISNKSRIISYLGQFADYEELKYDIYSDHDADMNTTTQGLEAEFWTQLPDSVKTCASLENAIQARDFKEYMEYFFTKNGEPRKSVKGLGLDTLVIANETQRISIYGAKVRALISAELNYIVLVIAAEVMAEYESRKADMGLIDYDDLLLKTIDLLQNSELAASVLYSLDCKIDHVLVDEAQDLSMKQWQVINLITEEFFSGEGAKDLPRTVFIVGDYKQSIYSFQGAEPEIFSSMKTFYQQRVLSAGLKWREVELEYSFRTTAPVLAAVDKLFATSHIAFRSGDGHVELLDLVKKPEKQEKTIPQAVQEFGSRQERSERSVSLIHDESRVFEVRRPQSLKSEGYNMWSFPQVTSESHDSKQVLADNIAQFIADAIKDGRELAGHKRAIVASDIMILVRKRSEFTLLLANSLAKHHIPHINQDKVILSEELIVEDLVALANFIITSADDFNLACLLKSPLIGIDDDELFRFAHNRTGTLYENLDATRKLQLSYYQKLASSLSVYEFFSTILDCDIPFEFQALEESDCFEYNKRLEFVSRFGKRANFVLDQFLEAALRFEQSCIPTFPTFIEWIQNGGADDSTGKFSSDDCVRIMTVHSAKGLQAPIVIIADAASSEQMPNDQIFWNDNKFYLSTLQEIDSDRITEVKKSAKQTRSEESKRLLYVAMTRAEDELYIAGWDNQLIKSSWYTFAAERLCNHIPPASYNGRQGKYAVELAVVPEFIRQKYMPELSEVAIKSITASEKVLHKTPEILRGEVIHELFQKLPLVADKNHYLDTMEKNSNISDFAEIRVKVTDIINKFPELFGVNSLAEVAVSGADNSNVRIDRLIFEKNKIKIIDFKSDRSYGRLLQHSKQLGLCKKLIRSAHPDKLVESYIIWVETGKLMPM